MIPKRTVYEPTGQASWRYRGVEWNQVGKLEVLLPERTGKVPHPELLIVARTEDADGDCDYWSVEENGVLVACGTLWNSDPLYRNGEGARLECERVICCGATGDDLVRVEAYLKRKAECALEAVKDVAS